MSTENTMTKTTMATMTKKSTVTTATTVTMALPVNMAMTKTTGGPSKPLTVSQMKKSTATGKTLTMMKTMATTTATTSRTSPGTPENLQEKPTGSESTMPLHAPMMMNVTTLKKPISSHTAMSTVMKTKMSTETMATMVLTVTTALMVTTSLNGAENE